MSDAPAVSATAPPRRARKRKKYDAKEVGLAFLFLAPSIAVFAAFALGQFLIVKVLGFTLAAAVLLDATLVRMAIGPALLRLAAPAERIEAAA